MAEFPHQTVRLSAGKHRSPAHGVCAMELSSMLSDDLFTDHPRKVCPVLAAFLRGYNDALPDRRRRDLFAVAAAVVGSRTPDSAARERRSQALQDLAMRAWRERRVPTPWPPLFPPDNAFSQLERVGWYVGRVARWNARVHAMTIELVTALAEERLEVPVSPEPLRPAAARG